MILFASTQDKWDTRSSAVNTKCFRNWSFFNSFYGNLLIYLSFAISIHQIHDANVRLSSNDDARLARVILKTFAHLSIASRQREGCYLDNQRHKIKCTSTNKENDKNWYFP